MCTRGHCTDKHYTQMVHVHGNGRTLNASSSRDDAKELAVTHRPLNGWDSRQNVTVKSESRSTLHATMKLDDGEDEGRQKNERMKMTVEMPSYLLLRPDE